MELINVKRQIAESVKVNVENELCQFVLDIEPLNFKFDSDVIMGVVSVLNGQSVLNSSPMASIILDEYDKLTKLCHPLLTFDEQQDCFSALIYLGEMLNLKNKFDFNGKIILLEIIKKYFKISEECWQKLYMWIPTTNNKYGV